LSVTQVEQLGGHALLYGTLPDGQTSVTAQCAGQHAAKPGDRITLYAPPGACHLFGADGLRLAPA
jgi:ABC-type sugar transport system ATPase subunit